MPNPKNSYKSEEEMAEIRQILEAMAADAGYSTEHSYRADSDKYPGNTISFADKHMDYLMTHKGVDPKHYVSNLRLMTRVR